MKDPKFMGASIFIRITGQVQGVGFRPFVYQQAVKRGLCGWVNNSLEGVQIMASGAPEILEDFTRALHEEKPAIARIDQFSSEQLAYQAFSSFEIAESRREGRGQLALTPDLALCDSCRTELSDPENRRYRYPFITCNYCGPRYSIMRQLPYDRDRTSMASFSMCLSCRDEYEVPSNWRFFSQTNSCGVCGISLALYSPDFQLLHSDYESCIAQVAEVIREGKIAAVKGIGGYLLLCDPCNPEALQTLRARKGRARKPFALMYPDLESARGDAVLDQALEKALLDPSSPIALAPARAPTTSPLCLELLVPGLDQLGIMLPYAPLFARILSELGHPIVATSGNQTNSPIVYRDGRALYELSKMADLILVNDREIRMPQDDSVLRFSKKYRQRILLRRSRGMAPAFSHKRFEGAEGTVLALGADLKSAFGFLHRGYAYLSQYLGDLDSFDTQERFRECRDRFMELFDEAPSVALIDKHPLYFSAQLGREWAGEHGAEVVAIQHHEAHFAAILGEHDLMDSPEPVLGVIWDGTGMGDDGQIWGGEFFTFSEGKFVRCGQLEYFDLILGDKMPREPRISALSAARGISGAEEMLRPKFSSAEWFIYEKLLQKTGNLKTSSMGRLFDAVSSLLGVLDIAEYEGEAPMYLERRAQAWFDREGMDYAETYDFGEISEGRILLAPLLGGILADLKRDLPAEQIAAKFHNTLVAAAAGMSNRAGINRLAFSGGVFQNALLVDLLIERLGKTHALYFHQQLSPNDECIAFGQLVWYVWQQKNV